MGILDRLSQMLRSNINDLISRAEDPEKMLNQILVDMRGQLVKAKQMVAAAIADEKRLRDQADVEYKQAAEWEQRAMRSEEHTSVLQSLRHLVCRLLLEKKKEDDSYRPC